MQTHVRKEHAGRRARVARDRDGHDAAFDVRILDVGPRKFTFEWGGRRYTYARRDWVVVPPEKCGDKL